MIELSKLKGWLADYITDYIHELESEQSEEFNKWARSFKREEAVFVVNMEFIVDWGYEKRKMIPEKEAKEYAETLIRTILDNWYR